MVRNIFLKVCAWALLTLAWALFIGFLAGRLSAQEARYEYRATPPGEPKPILIPCFVVDKFNFLCVETGEIFVDAAAARLVSFEGARGSAPAHRYTEYGRLLAAAAAPSIIPAHQKLASDAWVDRTKNKKGERCCDAGKDCHSLAPERVKPAPGGVIVTLDDGRVLFIPGEEIMPSEDGRYWLCYWNNQVKCFFAPFNGS